MEPLRRMRMALSDVHYIYTLVSDGAKDRFVLYAQDSEDPNPSGLDDQDRVDACNERCPEMQQALGNGHSPGRAAATDQPVLDKWGALLTGWAPILDPQGRQIGVVGVDVDARVYLARLAAARKWALFGLAPAGILIVILGSAFYRIRLRGLAAGLALAEAAWRDNLTGLANRALFMERLQKAVERVRDGEQPLFAVLFLDFDRFKLINDTLGHKAGDELLRQIARRLQGALRVDDSIGDNETDSLVGRLGGDEFLILLNDLNTSTDASLIAERLLEALAPVYRIFGSDVHSTASVGIVTSDQGHANADEAVRNADVAMYEAKRSGRARSVVFDEAMHARITRHGIIETGLRKALGTDELSVVYQPIVELKTGRMVSAEALLRWNHPTLGLISPCEFIPVAEDSGLMVAVGQWVLKEACQALVTWRLLDAHRAPKTVSVNISRAELAMGSRLLDHVRDALSAAGLPPNGLQLEVSEREVVRDPEASLDVLRQLRHLGVSLAMDAFGTGTSPLAILRRYPFDTIKIDRSFVEDVTNHRDVLAVMHAMINLVENLGMSSLAEGVEEPSQVCVLQSLGCRYAQGLYFGEPVTAEKLLGAARPHAVALVPSMAL
ncbi:MAG TPA: bifunctional diguanylate cyclase/phosphodiesterase [Steroidobacteraceae bacterium]|nr:bifunctional diguanylate cyclase/phosphodiesterase [Steroidobacteraceae bacterium]